MKRQAVVALVMICAGALLLVAGIYDLFGRGWALVAAAIECIAVYAAIARGIEE